MTGRDWEYKGGVVVAGKASRLYKDAGTGIVREQHGCVTWYYHPDDPTEHSSFEQAYDASEALCHLTRTTQ